MVQGVRGSINVLVKEKGLNIDTVRDLYKGMLVLSLLCSHETLTRHEYKFRARTADIDFLKRTCDCV